MIATVLAIRWLRFTLGGDEASASYFIGAENTISGISGWKVVGTRNL